MYQYYNNNIYVFYIKGGAIYLFEITKYKKSNVKITIRLPEDVYYMIKKISKKEDMSFNNVLVSCIQNSLDEMDLDKYKDVEVDI